jgi:hypothetical protein
MRALPSVVLLAAAFAIGTWILGWWAVPLIGAAWGVLQRGRPRFVTAFAAAALAWALLLAYDAVGGAMGGLTTTLGGIFMMPGALLLLVTLLYGALLAGCAAQVFGATPPRSAKVP